MAIEDPIIGHFITLIDILSSYHETNASVRANKLLTNGSHTVYPIMHQCLGASNLSRVALKSLNPEEVVIRKVH